MSSILPADDVLTADLCSIAYRLEGYVEHPVGHFTANVLHEGAWVKLDGAQMTCLALHDVRESSNVVMLFYTRLARADGPAFAKPGTLTSVASLKPALRAGLGVDLGI